MTYFRRQEKQYNIFEVMGYAQHHVFVAVSDQEYLIVSALRQMVEIARFRAADSEMLNSVYFERSARDLGLYDGHGWQLFKLATWLENDLRTCPVCGRAVTNRRATYDRAKCRQAAYRKRKR